MLYEKYLWQELVQNKDGYFRFQVEGMMETVEIKKELILRELKKTRISKHKTTTWKMLGKKVSSKWNSISVIEEINQQREKSW